MRSITTNQQRKEMVRRYKAGESTSSIGKAYGIKGQSVVWHLRRANVNMRPIGRPLGMKNKKKAK